MWALLGALAAIVLVTYTRVPAHELYHVSHGGIGGGLSRVLVELNFPDALVALAVLAVIWPQVPRPAAAGAAVLCLVFAVPGVVSQDDLDAKWINVVPAVGVLLVLALCLRTRFSAERYVRGDLARIVVVPVATVVCLEWLSAALGFYLGAPFFQTDVVVSYHGNAPHPAVHLGMHHGLDGLVFIVSACLLSRLPNRVSPLLALLFVYGVAAIVNDFWLEQVAERGWTSWTVPDSLHPHVNSTWLGNALVTPLVWRVWFRQPSAPTPASASAATS